jgi:hypothetical protein
MRLYNFIRSNDIFLIMDIYLTPPTATCCSFAAESEVAANSTCVATIFLL